MKEKVPAGLKTENPRTPKFYLQPRKLKKRNLGCPVVGSVNCHNSNISMYIVSFTTYCWINTILCQRRKRSYLLVTLDLKFLYANVLNNERIKTFQDITIFLGFILTLNNFIFNSVNYTRPPCDCSNTYMWMLIIFSLKNLKIININIPS